MKRQGRRHLPQRLAHHERRLDAAPAHGAGPRGGGTSIEEVGAGVTNVKPGDHVIFSFRPHCGRCFYCSIGPHHPLRRPHVSHAGACSTARTASARNGAGHQPDGAHRHLLRAGGVPGGDAGADPATRCRGRRPRSWAAACPPASGAVTRCAEVEAGASVARDRLRRRRAQRGAGRAAGRGRASSSPPTSSTTSSPTPRSSALPTRYNASRRERGGRRCASSPRAAASDYAFDAIGGEATTLQIVDAIRPGGTAVIVGMAALKRAGADHALHDGAARRRSSEGTMYGSVRPNIDFPKFVDLYLEGRLKIDELVSRTYKLDQISEGFAGPARGPGGPRRDRVRLSRRVTPAPPTRRPAPPAAPARPVVTSTCAHNCGGRCVVNAHVVDDRIVRISTDPRPLDPGHAAAAYLRARLRRRRARESSRIGCCTAPRRVGPRRARAGSSGVVGRGARRGGGALRRARRSPTAPPPSSTAPAPAAPPRSTTGPQLPRLLSRLGGCTSSGPTSPTRPEMFALRHTYGPAADCKFSGREPGDYAQLAAHAALGLEPRGRALRHRYHAVSPAREGAGRPDDLRGPAGDADEPAGRRTSTSPSVRARTPPCSIAMAEVIVSEGPPRPGLPRPLRGGLRRGAPARGARPPGASYRALPRRRGRRQRARRRSGAEPDGRARRHHPPARARLRHREAGRATVRFARPAAPPTASNSTSAAYALAALTGNVGIPGGSSGCSGARAITGSQRLGAGPSPAKSRVASPLFADLLARGRAGGYPADIKLVLLRVRRPREPAPQYRQDGGSAARGLDSWRWCTTTSSPPPRGSRRHRASRHHLLGAQ